jgi:SAM-dependent methyltransferase
MNLSEIVDLRNRLKYWSSQDLDQAINEFADSVTSISTDHPARDQHAHNTLMLSRKQLDSTVAAYKQSVEQYVFCLDQQISDIESAYLAKSYDLYDRFMRREQPDYILDRRLSLSDESMSIWQSRLAKYSDWKWPGMVIRPAREQWLHQMVALDPLYVLDLNYELLTPAVSKFSEVYQNRLRRLIINENHETKFLPDLPSHQLGICAVFNFFNYRPFEVIKRYLEEIMQTLRPGGILLMTYNNCDLSGAVALVEKGFMCYTPKRLILSLLESVGYDIVFYQDLDAACAIVEAQRPGRLTSIRGGQTLAQLNAIPEPPRSTKKTAKEPEPTNPVPPVIEQPKGQLTRPQPGTKTKPPGASGITRPKAVGK